MLHELLLALLGYTGDLIIDRRNNLTADNPISDECTFKLAPDISFIDPSDRLILKNPNFQILILFNFLKPQKRNFYFFL
jgi:hypothetical protein